MNKDNEKIEKALAAAYRDRPGREPGDDFEASVMKSLRNIPDVSENATWSRLVGKLFWELCPAACAIIIFLAIASFRLSIIPVDDFAQIVAADDSVEVMLADANR